MHKFSIFIEQEWKIFIARNLELWVVSQWENYNEAINNLKEATELYLEDENEENIFSNIKDKNYSLTTMNI